MCVWVCVYNLNVCVRATLCVFVQLFVFKHAAVCACLSVCVSQHAVWPWWPCFGWLMCWREQRGAQVGPEPQSDTLLLPCCFTYVDAARLLLPSHLTLPPALTQPTLTGSFFRALFWSFCLFQESKLSTVRFSSKFLFDILPLIVAQYNRSLTCWGLK